MTDDGRQWEGGGSWGHLTNFLLEIECEKFHPPQSDCLRVPRISAQTLMTNFISAGTQHLTGTSYTVIYHQPFYTF